MCCPVVCPCISYVADHTGAMLFDEESARWFTLPGQIPAGQKGHGLATTPAAL
jgi:hypothetical protein